MDLANIFSVTLLLVLLSISGLKSATVTLNKSTDKGQLGNNQISLFCDYTLSAGEGILSIELKRKRDADPDFIIIVFYYQDNQFNASYNLPDAADIENRTVKTNPTSTNRRTVLQFDSIQCSDEAHYRCDLVYVQSGTKRLQSNGTVVVTATPKFENQSLPYTPSTNLAENQSVNFTCFGNVGREPQGKFVWYKYLRGQTTSKVITDGVNPVSFSKVPGSCTYERTEKLTMQLTKDDNEMVIRCTVQQATLSEDGDGYQQTERISVNYAPRMSPIASDPDHPNYSEGLTQLTLTCNADSNPLPKYIWTLPDGREQTGSQLRLTSLTTNYTGIYTCMAYTEWGGQNYTANKSINITVVATTTPPPTTTTTTTRSSSTASVTKKPGTATASGENTSQADSTTGMIIGIVVGGVVVIIAIIIVIVCIKKRKKQEIEEPAEKPRNNRDLVFTGNRPDLVTSDEKWRNNQNNHMQNTSLNNSYDSSDSKVKADGQLTYVDLQFDDKPRSRKPIQLIDTGSTPYGEIAMPRV